MATTIGSSGAIDVNSIVTQLMQLEQRPLQALAKREAQVTAKITATAQIQGAVAGLQSAAAKLASASTYSGARANVTGDNLVAAVSDQTRASLGRYSISVESLSAGQALASGTFENGASPVGAGTLTFTRGTTRGSEFTAGTESPVNVTVEATDTLATLRDKINSAFANDPNGLSAALVADGGSMRLTLLAKGTGAANTFSITANDTGDGVSDDDFGLSQFAFDPTVELTPPATTAAGRNMLQTREGTDASLRVNGLLVTSTSNQVTGVIEGVTLDLKKAEPGKVNEVVVERDTTSMRAAINEFAKAYNDLNKMINDTTRFDAVNKKASALTGDTVARSVQFQVRALLGAEMKGEFGDFARLSDVGIRIQKDGTLKVDETALSAAVANPAKLSRLFTTTSDEPNARGLGVRFKALADSMIAADGMLPTRTKSLQSSVADIDKQEERINQRLVVVEQRLRKQYTALDAQMAQMLGQSTSLGSALDKLPGAAK